MPTRATPVCATLIAPQSALQRVPRGAHPSQGEPPPGTRARRHRRPAGHKGNSEWMGGLPPVPLPAGVAGGTGSRVKTRPSWPPATPRAPYYIDRYLSTAEEMTPTMLPTITETDIAATANRLAFDTKDMKEIKKD